MKSCFIGSQLPVFENSRSSNVFEKRQQRKSAKVFRVSRRQRRRQCTRQTKMLLHPMVYAAQLDSFPVMEEMERSFRERTLDIGEYGQYAVKKATVNLGSVRNKHWTDSSSVSEDLSADAVSEASESSSCSSFSSSSSSSSNDNNSLGSKKSLSASLIYLEDNSPIRKREKRRKRKSVVEFHPCLSRVKMINERFSNQASSPAMSALSSNTSSMDTNTAVKVKVCGGKCCKRHEDMQTVMNSVSELALTNPNIEVVKGGCQKQCSKNGVTVTIQGKSFRGVTAKTFYEQWKSSCDVLRQEEERVAGEIPTTCNIEWTNYQPVA